MLTYSQHDLRRQLISDQHLWRRLPGAAVAVIWPLAILLLGWEAGRWVGPVAAVGSALLAEALPERLDINVYLVDLLDRLLKLPLALLWLLFAWHLATREPAVIAFGSPILGAILATGLAWLMARVLIVATRLLAPRIPALRGAGRA